MNTYNVYFSARKEEDEQNIIALTREFIHKLHQHDLIMASRFNKVIQPGNFTELPDYHLAVEFKDKQRMDEAFERVRKLLMNEPPHSMLMREVTNFKVSFSQTID